MNEYLTHDQFIAKSIDSVWANIALEYLQSKYKESFYTTQDAIGYFYGTRRHDYYVKVGYFATQEECGLEIDGVKYLPVSVVKLESNLDLYALYIGPVGGAEMVKHYVGIESVNVEWELLKASTYVNYNTLCDLRNAHE